MLTILYHEKKGDASVELRKWAFGDGAQLRADAVLEISQKTNTPYGEYDKPTSIVHFDPLAHTDAEMIREAIRALDNLASASVN